MKAGVVKIKTGYNPCCMCPDCNYFDVCELQKGILVGSCKYIEQLEEKLLRLKTKNRQLNKALKQTREGLIWSGRCGRAGK